MGDNITPKQLRKIIRYVESQSSYSDVQARYPLLLSRLIHFLNLPTDDSKVKEMTIETIYHISELPASDEAVYEALQNVSTSSFIGVVCVILLSY